jgi:hypothetical protein
MNLAITPTIKPMIIVQIMLIDLLPQLRQQIVGIERRWFFAP